jgi:ABC-type dipeptide/oligopeptide/nickel transport system permease component
MMFRALARRLATTALTLLAVSAVVFVALAATPGDAAGALAGESASETQLQTLRADLGLDQPLWLRYGMFLANAVSGDFGRSLVNHQPVGELLLARLPYSLILAGAALILAVVIGLSLGIFAALNAGTPTDTVLMGGAAFGLAVPTFWSGLLFMLFFSVRLRWLPVVGADSGAHLILPAVVLALPTAALLARQMRASLLDVMHADYVRTARAKGLLPRHVLSQHMLRNSLLPVVTVLGLCLGHLIAGAFIVESIFGWPGLGRLTVQAVFDRDVPVVLGATLLVAALFLLINLFVDLLHGWLDPQIGHHAL